MNIFSASWSDCKELYVWMSMTSGAVLNALLNLLDIYIQSTARGSEGLLEKVNPMPSDSRIPVHLFGRRYQVVRKRRENWK